MLNLSILLEDSARRYPDAKAFTFNGSSLSFQQIDQAANMVANGLRAKGFKEGDKIALSCFNLPYFPIIYFGVMKMGGVLVPLSVLLKKEEIIYHLKDSEAKAYFAFIGSDVLPMGQMAHQGFLDVDTCKELFIIMPTKEMPSAIEGLPTFGSFINGQSNTFESYPTDAEDTAVIIYTSGTTGRPKGAMLTHSNLMYNAILSADLFNSKHGENQLIVLPLFHIFAMTTLMNAGLYRGLHSVLLPRFDVAQVFKLMEEEEVNIFAGVPTMYWGMVNYQGENINYDKISKNLRVSISGGASLPVQVLYDYEEKFKVKIMEGYGMSEGSPVVTFNHMHYERKPGSVGTPVWGVEVKLVDEDGKEVATGEKGQLLYRGHNVMKGYWKNEEATAKTLAGGWLHSGDIAIKDEEGFYFIVDRTKDMIIRGGLNVYPREVEEVMIKHPSISLVAVIGIPDEQFGEEIKACIVLKEGATVDVEEVKQFTKDNLAAYKYPRVLEIMDALPMSATGKILKKVLRGEQ